MDDEGDDDPVPLPNVNAAILKKVHIDPHQWHVTNSVFDAMWLKMVDFGDLNANLINLGLRRPF